jgi:hypothetical protein
MRSKYMLFSLVLLACFFKSEAQDSAKVAQAFTALVSICKNVDFSDPKVQESGTFYKAAPYIVYRGDDVKRKWKDVANYHNAKEKEQVDNICFKINSSVNQDSSYKIAGYLVQKESEGTWHLLMISYMKKGREKHAVFAFLKIGNRYALGDID